MLQLRDGDLVMKTWLQKGNLGFGSHLSQAGRIELFSGRPQVCHTGLSTEGKDLNTVSVQHLFHELPDEIKGTHLNLNFNATMKK